MLRDYKTPLLLTLQLYNAIRSDSKYGGDIYQREYNYTTVGAEVSAV
jgi:hypothetical protein